jgi:hypothetical protein
LMSGSTPVGGVSLQHSKLVLDSDDPKARLGILPEPVQNLGVGGGVKGAAAARGPMLQRGFYGAASVLVGPDLGG